MDLRPLGLPEMPKAAQQAMLAWLLAWVCLLADYYLWTADTGWVGKMAAAIGLLTFFMLKAQNWSRMIAMMASAMAVLFSAILVYALRGQPLLLLLSVASFLLFALCLFFLLDRATARFFKAQRSSESKEDIDSTR